MDDILDDDEQLIMEELKQEFIETVPGNLAKLRDFYNANEFKEISRIAHDIKGTAGAFGFDEGTNIAERLQLSAEKKNIEKTRHYLDKLINYMEDQGIDV
jgi:HPt (histidine-containing phosphotransfer) domain-containing protein